MSKTKKISDNKAKVCAQSSRRADGTRIDSSRFTPRTGIRSNVQQYPPAILEFSRARSRETRKGHDVPVHEQWLPEQDSRVRLVSNGFSCLHLFDWAVGRNTCYAE